MSKKLRNDDKKSTKNDSSSSKMKVISVIQEVRAPAYQKRSTDSNGDEPVAITMPIDNCIFMHIVIDTGSSSNIIFKDTF